MMRMARAYLDPGFERNPWWIFDEELLRIDTYLWTFTTKPPERCLLDQEYFLRTTGDED